MPDDGLNNCLQIMFYDVLRSFGGQRTLPEGRHKCLWPSYMYLVVDDMV